MTNWCPRCEKKIDETGHVCFDQQPIIKRRENPILHFDNMCPITKLQELIDKKIPIHFETVNEGDLYDIFDGELTWSTDKQVKEARLKFENIVNEVYERSKKKYPELF